MKTDQAFARPTDPETSHDAAASIDLREMRARQRAVLSLLEIYGPMTHEQMVERYGDSAATPPWLRQSPSGIRTRCKELVRLGQIRDSGGRAVLASGRKAIIWEAVS